MKDSLGRIGIWSGELGFGDSPDAGEAVAELDELGFGALWIPGGVSAGVLKKVTRLQAGSRRISIGTGIINIWKETAADVGTWWRDECPDQNRVMLGLGVSHGPLIGADYSRPLEVMRTYLDALDSEGVPANRRCLAALAPKMLELARDRTAGSHPYLVPPEHAAYARERLGPDALLAPEVGVVLETDPETARARARKFVSFYLTLPNYVNNWRRLGYTEEDVTTPSDRLIDAVFAWGSLDQIRKRVNEHLDAGASHVCLQVIQDSQVGSLETARDGWRKLAEALL